MGAVDSILMKCMKLKLQLSHLFMYNGGFPGSSADKESAYNARDLGSILGWGRSPGKGIGYPFQYSWNSLVAQLVKDPPVMREIWALPTCQCRRCKRCGFSPWVGKIPWRRG